MSFLNHSNVLEKWFANDFGLNDLPNTILDSRRFDFNTNCRCSKLFNSTQLAMKYEIYNLAVVFLLGVSLWLFSLNKISEAIYIAILANAIKNFLKD